MPAGTVNGYPFTAVVGMDDAKRALECALSNPNIHTVLLRGSEGSAKTLLSRAAANLTDRVIVNCPLNVTDEQLFGGLDVEEAIKTGKSRLQPGLLSRAHGNILYIDDVNLMDRGMLAGILDAVLTGTVHVERGSISDSYACDTTLIATMNPDDSDLSAHMLDRFDLVAYAPPRDEAQRRQILERNSVYSSDPEGFVRLFEGDEGAERMKIDKAVKILPLVTISDELISVISELCIKVGADGARGDLAMVNCAKSLA
ncbi:MAG: ATP-binding protein, partial [Candidatus Methanomethylophilaceae archaeon]|nr:ATP-binding protein [Candidatus Methanomethylophilaceae archaeon]